ncbi:MAG: hypothetical protein M1269_03780 [Chloroflexi bacterium]|nr:hypothetical protein [Chloroflexota bacterium]
MKSNDLPTVRVAEVRTAVFAGRNRYCSSWAATFNGTARSLLYFISLLSASTQNMNSSSSAAHKISRLFFILKNLFPMRCISNALSEASSYCSEEIEFNSSLSEPNVDASLVRIDESLSFDFRRSCQESDPFNSAVTLSLPPGTTFESCEKKPSHASLRLIIPTIMPWSIAAFMASFSSDWILDLRISRRRLGRNPCSLSLPSCLYKSAISPARSPPSSVTPR